MGDQVAGPRPRRPGGVVLDHGHPELAQLTEHVVGDLALGPGRARDLAEPHEAVEACAGRRSRAEGYGYFFFLAFLHFAATAEPFFTFFFLHFVFAFGGDPPGVTGVTG